MERYLIVADDFTGANDTGVQLRRRGFATNVMFAGRPLPAGEACVVIDTESRGLPSDEAAEIITKAVDGLDLGAYKYVIKKVDSTLRGNLAEEIQALDRAYGAELVVFAPALPDLGRTTEGGVHKLNGVPITQTELAKDPKKPVLEDHIDKILRGVYAESVVHVGLDTVRSGNIPLDGGRVFTFDAVTNEDMRRIIAAAQATGRKVLWVGTAAMADNIMEMGQKTAPVLGVAASVSAVTLTQIRAAERAGIPLVSVPFHRLLSGEEKPDDYIESVVSWLQSGRDTILVSSGTLFRDDLDNAFKAGADRGMTPLAVSDYVQKTMGRMAACVLAQAAVSGVFITGGDTAMGLLSELQSDGSIILSEISVGIPMMRLVGGAAAGLKMVTKAGAFGSPEAVTFAFRKLKEV